MKEMENAFKFEHTDGDGMDCVTSWYAEIAISSPTEKEQKFVRFSLFHNPPISI